MFPRLHPIAVAVLLMPVAAALAQTDPAQRVEITGASPAKLEQGAATGRRRLKRKTQPLRREPRRRAPAAPSAPLPRSCKP